MKTNYDLQNIVLDHVFSCNNSFYLTGGTALNRFYIPTRVSEDLDFFTSEIPLFYEFYNEIVESLSKILYVKTIVQERDFHRILVSKEDTKLQVDFVNDRVYRYGKSKLYKNMRLDNLVDILSNKLTVILNREDSKDIIDIISICNNYSFEWENLFDIANKKQPISTSHVINKINEFPLNLLEQIKWISQEVKIEITSSIKDDLAQICADMMILTDNSLGESKHSLFEAIPNLIEIEPDQLQEDDRPCPSG